MVPSSLLVWVQRAGRAGRSSSPSCAVLLYEPSVAKRVSVQEGNEDNDDEDGDQEWAGEDFEKRNVEDSLRSYILTNKCRRLLADAYFGNPPRNAEGASSHTGFPDSVLTRFTGYIIPCCDNCLKNDNPLREFLLIIDLLSGVFGPSATVSGDSDTIQHQNEGIRNEDDDSLTDSGILGENNAAEDTDEDIDDMANPCDPTQPKKPGPRRGQRLADCREFLTGWRHKCWKRNYCDHIWGPSIVLPDKLITKFASSAWVKSIEDVCRELGAWMWVDEYSQEVLEGLEEIDQRYEEVRQKKEEEKQREKAEQQAEYVRKKEEQRVERERKKAEQQVESERKKAEAQHRAAEWKEQTKKRRAEKRVRKREEKKREEQIMAEEREIEEIEEMEKRRRTSYSTYLNPALPSQIQDFPLSSTLPLPPRPRPRPKPTMHLPPAQDDENAGAVQSGVFQ